MLDRGHSNKKLAFIAYKPSWAKFMYTAIYRERRHACYDPRDLDQENINIQIKNHEEYKVYEMSL